MAESFDEYEFRERMREALASVKLVLASNRTFCLPDETPHSYADKYLLADTCTRLATAASLVLLEEAGLSKSSLDTIIGWARNNEVSLRFESAESFKYVGESTRSVEDPHSSKVSTSMGFSATAKTFTKITEHTFVFSFAYRLLAMRGVGADAGDSIELQSRSASQKIVQRSKEAVYPEAAKHSEQANISWLLRQVARDEETGATDIPFTIDRSKDTCFTPRRNEDVKAALELFEELQGFARRVDVYLTQHLIPVQTMYSSDRVQPGMDLLQGHVFGPVLPLLERGEDEEQALAFAAATRGALIAEMQRSFGVLKLDLLAAFPAPASDIIVTSAEATLLAALYALEAVSAHYADALNFLEAVIRKQLVAAIGKVVLPSDLDAYMHFHYRRLLREEFQPRPFSHAIRRSLAHSPEGSLRIDESADGKVGQPLLVFTKSDTSAAPMFFNLSSSSKVAFEGERQLHLHLGHSFEGQTQSSLTLVAQARQFSSFILLVGRIASASEFDPKYGIILQNKDELSIPLMLEQVPTAKEFRKAVESLSPEQQKFASAIRSMQLGGTVFGVLVVQIKPHLEKLLRLKPDSLTKEIALGQDLMDMFVKYQIPSDLVSFEGDEGTNAGGRVDQVRGHVEKIKAMLRKAKEDEVEEKKLHDLAVYGSPPVPAPVAGYGGVGSELLQPTAERFRSVSKMSAPLMMMSKKSFASGHSPSSGTSMAFRAQAPPSFAMEAREMESSEDVSFDAPKGGSEPPEQVGDQTTPLPAEHAAAVLPQHTVDYTSMPSQLDAAHDKYDPDSALRSTIINPSETWTKKAQKGLMRPPVSSTQTGSELVVERCAAFDLLDALSRSGSSVLSDAALHVVIATTHCFDKSLMDTVVQRNVNPIERVERSSLILASTLHGLPVTQLLKQDHVSRVQSSSPALFIEEGRATTDSLVTDFSI